MPGCNKSLFIWKRMLFVSHTSLLESLLSVAVNVLLTGRFITLLAPWGVIPEKHIINCFWGQARGSAVPSAVAIDDAPRAGFCKSTCMTEGDRAQSDCCCSALTDTA